MNFLIVLRRKMNFLKFSNKIKLLVKFRNQNCILHLNKFIVHFDIFGFGLCQWLVSKSIYIYIYKVRVDVNLHVEVVMTIFQ